jgi:H2-forming N5,N10-methylenetetrahydromethanopterin dehydrogenase-like enzyme
MVARMNRIEDAARLARADLGVDAARPAVIPGMTFTVKLGLVLASLAVTGLLAASLL